MQILAGSSLKLPWPDILLRRVCVAFSVQRAPCERVAELHTGIDLGFRCIVAAAVDLYLIVVFVGRTHRYSMLFSKCCVTLRKCRESTVD